MFGIIYGLENCIDQKIYVGQTKRTLEERFNEHKKTDTYIGNAIRKYGVENFLCIVLEECETQEELNEAEIKWIARLNCMTPNGYNCTAGGEGVRSFHHTDLTKKQISETLTGRKQTEEHKANNLAAQQKRWQDPNEHEKASAGQIKRYEDPLEHEKTSAALKKSRQENPIPKESRVQQAESLKKFYQNNPDMKAYLSEMTDKQFATPESRANHSEIMIQYYAEHKDSDETRLKKSIAQKVRQARERAEREAAKATVEISLF